MDHGGSAAQFLEKDNKSPCYIELSASLALVPVCIGCSLSLQLSAWGGTVNDVFVLRSPFVLSWFLEQHKQAWNLFYPPRKKKKKKMGGIQVCRSTIQRCGWERVNLIFVFPAPLCLSEGFISTWKRDISVGSQWTVDSLVPPMDYLTTEAHRVCQKINMSPCVSGVQWDLCRDWLQSSISLRDATQSCTLEF